ncbi:hypothetical protein [Streptomyces sp. bgisy100]|uniref:hypothetical protein n=1 Tax=Streptomyces sp. bgisy100 TaxID=3413783 RepID=UPI003D763CED
MNTSSNRRRSAVTAAAVAVLGLGTVSAWASSASAGETDGMVDTNPYVLNLYGEENADHGDAQRTPKNLVLSEFTSLNKVHWKQWGKGKAVGTADVTGNWCLETCQDKPLRGKVTLSDPKEVGGEMYYSSFTLKLAPGSGHYESEDLNRKHALPTP